MGNGKIAKSIGMTGCEPCHRSKKEIKSDIKKAQNNLDIVMDLRETDLLDYECGFCAVGKAYHRLRYLQDELKRVENGK